MENVVTPTMMPTMDARDKFAVLGAEANGADDVGSLGGGVDVTVEIEVVVTGNGGGITAVEDVGGSDIRGVVIGEMGGRDVGNPRSLKMFSRLSARNMAEQALAS
jgi:hypothetical protein